MSRPNNHVATRISSHSWDIAPGAFKAYGFAMLLVAAAAVLCRGLEFVTLKLQTVTTFFPAVLFAALVGGAGPGIFAAVLSGSVWWLNFLSPFSTRLPLTVGDELNLITFIIASALVVWATDHYRRVTKRLRDEERFRRLVVDELAHRLKNKVATIQSFIVFRLRNHPDVRDETIRSLSALTATDDLISSSQGHGADIRNMLSAELSPYDPSRISMKRKNLLLHAKLALTFAWLLHELATNAAKYGAPSVRRAACFRMGARKWTIGSPLVRELWAARGPTEPSWFWKKTVPASA